MSNQESRVAIVPTGAGSLRQRAFAWALAHLNAKYEKFVASRKRQLLGNLSGKVLEIGPGTGANLRYFPKDRIQWIGIEPNPFMFQYLENEAARLGMQIAMELQITCEFQIVSGVSRLRELLLGQHDAPLESLQKAILDAVRAFSRGANQADDITVLLARYRSATNSATLLQERA